MLDNLKIAENLKQSYSTAPLAVTDQLQVKPWLPNFLIYNYIVTFHPPLTKPLTTVAHAIRKEVFINLSFFQRKNTDSQSKPMTPLLLKTIKVLEMKDLANHMTIFQWWHVNVLHKP